MKHDLSDMIAMTDRLRAQAAEVLERRLDANPDDPEALWKMGELHRQSGRLDAASECFERLLGIDPARQRAEYLRAILRGTDLPRSAPRDGFQPAPFLRLGEFLSAAQVDKVWDLLRAKKENFIQSGLESGKVDLTYRSSMRLRGDDLSEIADWFLDRVHSSVSMSWPRLGVEPFTVSVTELQLTRHMDGAFFKIHRDSGLEESTRTRRLTFVYYFFEEPQPFEGGDLLLFDTQVEDEGESTLGFTRLAPLNNSIVLFPSRCWHQVTPVHLSTDRFEGGRFTLNGWLHAEDPPE